jgi:hypothetical protein
MDEQNYANHRWYVKGFHFALSLLLIIGSICSVVNIYVQWSAGNGVMNALLIVWLFICTMILYVYTRQFPVKVQDRVIRAEENLRYFMLTRKPIDSRISMSQIIALRFASDDEFVTLVDRAINENLSQDEIKKAIKNWRADNHRA